MDITDRVQRESVNIFASDFDVTAIDVQDPRAGGIVTGGGRREGDQIFVVAIRAKPVALVRVGKATASKMPRRPKSAMRFLIGNEPTAS